MTEQIFNNIRTAIDRAEGKTRTAKLHLQMIKYADELSGCTGREFCERLGIGISFGTEFSKMKNIAARLKCAGLNIDQI